MKKTSILVLAVIAVIAVSSLSLALNTASASVGDTNMQAMSNRLVEKSWIKINGYISEWGTTKVNGVLQTQARTALLKSDDTRQLASATATWTTNNTRPINSVKSKENFTYTFYVARLSNASVSTLSTGKDNYFLNGTWNVYTVVSTITVTTNANNQIVNVHRESDTSVKQAYGELSITDNWSKFNLTITGQDTLTGSVFRSMTRQVQFNPFKVLEDTNVKVTRADIGEVFKCYRAMPGWGSYDSRMDFNNNFKIDITDLSTVASNL
jgi:Tfp pilus assembly protein PilE